MIVLRRILMLVFAAAYLALCPALVFHVLQILQTGLIKVNSEPGAASVSLNGRTIDGATPLTIPELSPGTHRMSVSAPGYRTWAQSVTVNQGQVIELERVLLLPDELQVRELTGGGFERMIAIAGVPFMLLAPGDTAGAWRIFDMKKATLRPLLPAGSPMVAGRVEDIFITQRSYQIVAHITLDGTPRFLRVNIATEPHRIDDLSARFPEPAVKVMWDVSAEDVLFSFRDGKVRKIDLRLGRDDPNFGSDWRGLGVFDQRVFHMNRGGRIESMAFDKSSKETIFDDPGAGREIFGETAVFSIWPRDRKTILFHGDNGRLCQSGLPNVLVEEGVRGVRVDGESSRMLVWMSHKIGVLEASAKATGESGRFQKGRQVTWVFENADDIRDAWFVDGGSHAVMQDGGRLVLLELFAGVQARPREIARVKPASGIRYDHEGGVIHALEPKRGRLVSIRIAPPRSPPRRSP